MKKGAAIFLVLALGICSLVWITSKLVEPDHFDPGSLKLSEREGAEGSDRWRLIDAARDCLRENNIKAPQSEKSLAHLLVGENSLRKNYMSEMGGLTLSEDGVFQDLRFNLQYTITFDGGNIIVREPNLSPEIEPLNGP